MSLTQFESHTNDFSHSVALNLELVQEELAATVAGIDAQQLVDLSGQLRTAERVFVAGAGRSGLVLRMAAMRLMHLGLTVHVVGDTTTPAIRPRDLLLVASGSGTTSGVVNAAETAEKVGANIAAMTTNAQSPLATLADVLVIIPAAQKTDHESGVSLQYSGSLFEQALFLSTEAVFQTLWGTTNEPAEQLWRRHANLE